MKNIFKKAGVFLIAVLLLSSIAVSASSSANCVINGNFESITYNGKTYLPITNYSYFNTPEYSQSVRVTFSDKNIKQQYADKDIYVSVAEPYIEFYAYNSSYSKYISHLFIEEGRYQSIVNILNKKSADGFITYNDYTIEPLNLTVSEINDWTLKGTRTSVPASNFSELPCYELYSVTQDGLLEIPYGLIIRQKSLDVVADTYYLLLYGDYDTSFFYADGSFAFENNERIITLYTLADGEFSESLSAFYDTLPEDELDWMVNTEFSKTVFFIITLIFLGIIPFAAITVSVVLLIVKKPKNPYLTGLTAIISSSAIIICGYIVLLCILL